MRKTPSGNKQIPLRPKDYISTVPAIPFHMGTREASGIEQKFHSHGGLEMGTILRGKAVWNIGNRRYDIKRGECWFFRGRIPHYIQVNKNSDLKTLFVEITPRAIHAVLASPDFSSILEPFSLSHENQRPIIKKAGAIAGALKKAYAFKNSTDRFGAIKAWQQVLSALILIAEEQPIPSKSRLEHGFTGNKIVEKALAIISENPAGNISLQELARLCNTSVSYLSHHFTREMHMAPIAFRNSQRILLAVEKFASSPNTIESVAADCGFSSLSQFRLLFKKQTGLSPSAFVGRTRSRRSCAG